MIFQINHVNVDKHKFWKLISSKDEDGKFIKIDMIKHLM